MEEKTMRELSLDEMDQVSGGTGNGTESNGENTGLVGTVTMCMRDNVYSVELANGHMVTARISAKLRMNSIKLLEGDRVQVEGDWITYIYR